MDELGIEQWHMMGASMGTFVTQQFVIDYPDKVNRIVLISPSPHLDLPRHAKLLRKVLPYVPLGIILRFFARDIISREDGNVRKRRREYREKAMEHTSQETAVARAELTREMDFRKALSRVTHDVLIVYGEYDRFMGEPEALKTEEALSNANVEVISFPTGHYPQWTLPAPELRRFL